MAKNPPSESAGLGLIRYVTHEVWGGDYAKVEDIFGPDSVTLPNREFFYLVVLIFINDDVSIVYKSCRVPGTEHGVTFPVSTVRADELNEDN